jgi:2-methylcitrate dehydratase PrpD
VLAGPSTASAELSREVLDQYAGRFMTRETFFKYHSSCYLTHASIQATKGIRDTHRVDPRTIEAIKVRISKSLLGVCNIEDPKTGLEGNFSLLVTIATALLEMDTGSLATFSYPSVIEPNVVAMRDRVRAVPVEKIVGHPRDVIVKPKGNCFTAEADSGSLRRSSALSAII